MTACPLAGTYNVTKHWTELCRRLLGPPTPTKVRVSPSAFFWAKIMNTHKNYVVGFSDGTVKVGTTKRPMERIAEVAREKSKSGFACVMQVHIGEATTRKEAFRVERNTCSLLRSMRIGAAREWMKSAFMTPSETFNYIKQTVGMFKTVGISGDRRSCK